MTIAAKFKKLELYRGKRNAVITIIIPPDANVQKEIASLIRRVMAIKHVNKRIQLIQVFDMIITQPQNRHTEKVGSNGKIICAGLNNQNFVDYYELDPPNKIEKFEYYYDFFFYVDRIREIWYRDVIYVPDEQEKNKIINKLENNIKNCDPTIILGENSINGALIMSVVKDLYCFSEQSLTDDRILKVINSGGTIIKILDDKMKEKYGNEIGVSWFVVDEYEELVEIPLD